MPFLTQVEHQVIISCVTGPIPTQEHSKLFIFISRPQPAALIMEIRIGMAFIQSVYAYIWLSSLKSKVVFFLGVVLLTEKLLFQYQTGCSKFQVFGKQSEGSVSPGKIPGSPKSLSGCSSM